MIERATERPSPTSPVAIYVDTLRMAKTTVQHYLPKLMERIEKGEIDVAGVITHKVPLTESREI